MRIPLAVAVMVLLETTAPVMHAQAPGFEAVSIKANRSGSTNWNFPGLANHVLTATNVSLLHLIQAAYDLSLLRISAPDWLDKERFDLTGKSPEGVADGEMRLMLQALLKDRFKVSFHREKKEMQVFEMVIAREGLKMAPFDGVHYPRAPRTQAGGVIMGTGTMSVLAQVLDVPVGAPVVDKTGLDGRYGYALAYTPVSPYAELPPDSGPDIFTAVREQLGLRLVPGRGPVEILVVDHAERVPTEN